MSAPPPALGRRYEWRAGDVPDWLSDVAREALRSFEKKAARGEYVFETAACFCGAEDDVALARRDRYGLPYSLVLCRRCGLARATPRLTGDSYKAFYGAEYRPLYADEDFDLSARHEVWKREGREVHRTLVASGFRGGVVLDVGCNTGACLVPFRDAGCEVFGVDFGAKHLAFGRRREGLSNLFEGGVERFAALGRTADLVLLRHVVEHFTNLEETLRAVRSILRERALVYVEVPGSFSWAERHCGGNLLYLLQNAHTYQFSLASLTYVMECCGFERIEGDERVCALFARSERRRSRDDVPAGETARVLAHWKGLERRYLPIWAVGRILAYLGLKPAIDRLRRRRDGCHTRESGPPDS